MKGTRGHIYHPIAVDGCIPAVYESKVLKVCKMKHSGTTCFVIDYDFLDN